MTVMSAKDAAAYEGMADSADPFEGERPQRHNIVFNDGFPTDKWYGTQNLQQAHKRQEAKDGVQYVHADRQNTAQTNAGIHMAGFDVGAFAASVQQVFDKLKQGRYVSVETLEGVVENSSEQVRSMMEGAMQNLRNALQQISGEMRTSTNMKLGQITASLDTLSSTCDMLENFDVEVLANRMRTGEEERDERIDDMVSDASDSLSDMADGLRGDIEEIADHIEEIRDALSM